MKTFCLVILITCSFHLNASCYSKGIFEARETETQQKKEKPKQKAQSRQKQDQQTDPKQQPIKEVPKAKNHQKPKKVAPPVKEKPARPAPPKTGGKDSSG